MYVREREWVGEKGRVHTYACVRRRCPVITSIITKASNWLLTLKQHPGATRHWGDKDDVALSPIL